MESITPICVMVYHIFGVIPDILFDRTGFGRLTAESAVFGGRFSESHRIPLLVPRSMHHTFSLELDQEMP